MEKHEIKWKNRDQKNCKSKNYNKTDAQLSLHSIIPITLLLFVLLFYSSCMRDPKPRNTISKEKFVNVLTDIHIAEAMFQERRRINLDSLQSKAIYLSVLNKYNVTEEKMLATTLYYSRHPREYDKIYTEVVSRMQRMIEETQSPSLPNEKVK